MGRKESDHLVARLSIECSRHTIDSPGFPSILPFANFRVTVRPPHLPCGAEYSIPQLTSAAEKGKELEVG